MKSVSERLLGDHTLVKKYLWKQKVWNYRHSRSRSFIESILVF